MEMFDSWSVSNFDMDLNELQNDSIGGLLRSILNVETDFEEAINKVSPELKREQREWEQKFPKLIVHGKEILVKKNQSLNSPKTALVQKIVKDHLWPQVNF